MSSPSVGKPESPNVAVMKERHIKRKLNACVNRSDAPTIRHALEQLSAKGSGRKAGEGFVVEAGMEGARVAADTGNVHTPKMTLKNAALFALIGTILMTALLVWAFVSNVLNVLRGLVPAVTLFSSFIYAFGCFSVAVFLYVFYRTQASGRRVSG